MHMTSNDVAHLAAPQIARYRNELGISLDEVARRVREVCPGRGVKPCGVRRQEVSLWERGIRPPSQIHLFCLAEAFGTDVANLLAKPSSNGAGPGS